MGNIKLLNSLLAFYETKAVEIDSFVEQDLAFINQDLEADLLMSVGNISDSLGRLSVHYAIVGIAALLKNEEDGWVSIHKSMLYLFWSIKLAECSLRKIISMNPNKNVPELRAQFSESAGLLLYCIFHEQKLVSEIAGVLRKIFINNQYMTRDIVDGSSYERFALNVYYLLYENNEENYLSEVSGSVYGGLHKKLFDKSFRASDIEALCDYHCRKIEDKAVWRPEFCTPPFDVLPIEVMIIYKLREKVGLATPSLSHPLLNPILLNMPVMEFKHDFVISQVEGKYREFFSDEQQG